MKAGHNQVFTLIRANKEIFFKNTVQLHRAEVGNYNQI